MENTYGSMSFINNFLWFTQGLLLKATALSMAEKVQGFESISDFGVFIERVIIDKEHQDLPAWIVARTLY
jgi:hypothetical protein